MVRTVSVEWNCDLPITYHMLTNRPVNSHAIRERKLCFSFSLTKSGLTVPGRLMSSLGSKKKLSTRRLRRKVQWPEKLFQEHYRKMRSCARMLHKREERGITRNCKLSLMGCFIGIFFFCFLLSTHWLLDRSKTLCEKKKFCNKYIQK